MSADTENSNQNPVDPNRESITRKPSESNAPSSRKRQRALRRLDQLTPSSIVDVTDVQELTTLSRATIYRKMKAGTFPSNRQLAANRAGWRLADVQAWLENLR
ncbi:MAG: helix-turn-helix transcriptional regulator [Allosphingosinicella sp.]|uniref:helix-turn-helix transcriptional regulator n=1 Tax=Allosphingosinicella sp. TaxID=2823234 RepID=UPI003945A7D2